MNSVEGRDRFDQMTIPIEQEVSVWENYSNIYVAEMDMLDHKGIQTQWGRWKKCVAGDV